MEASGSVEDAGERPTKLQKVSEELGEQGGGENSPSTTQVESGDPDSEADASEASGSVEDAGEQPKKPQGASERERKRSKPKEEDYSPDRPREEPEDPGGEAVASGGVQGHLEHTRTMENERVVETNALRRGRGPGGHIGEKDETGGVETDRRRESDGKCIN